MKKIAWLAERGDNMVGAGIYNEILPLPEYQIDFFSHQSEIYDMMNNGYDLFVIGLCVGGDDLLSYPLIDAIRANKKTKNTPILVHSTNADMPKHELEIRERDVSVLHKPHDGNKLRRVVRALI